MDQQWKEVHSDFLSRPGQTDAFTTVHPACYDTIMECVDMAVVSMRGAAIVEVPWAKRSRVRRALMECIYACQPATASITSITPMKHSCTPIPKTTLTSTEIEYMKSKVAEHRVVLEAACERLDGVASSPKFKGRRRKQDPGGKDHATRGRRPKHRRRNKTV